MIVNKIAIFFSSNHKTHFRKRESPRWLNTKGKFKEVRLMVERMAEQNGVSINMSDIVAAALVHQTSDNYTLENLRARDLFRPRKVMARSLNLFFQVKHNI